jgi:2'-5' RNA ligase
VTVDAASAAEDGLCRHLGGEGGVRLFVGIEIEPAVAAAAADLVREVRARAERLAPRARITWVSEERFHITVAFIGAADAAAAERIAAALQPTFGEPPFDVTFVGTGAFPPRGAPRVVWIDVAGGREQLMRIERGVRHRLTQAGIRAEERAYRPHLTLARVRDAAGLTSRTLLEGFAGTSLGRSRVEAITLFESRLSPRGPDYVPRHRTPLT